MRRTIHEKRRVLCNDIFATGDTIQSEKKIKERFSAFIIPTPREISTSCGFAIRFDGLVAEETILISLQQELNVNCDLYHLGQKGQNGKRSVVMLASHRIEA